MKSTILTDKDLDRIINILWNPNIVGKCGNLEKHLDEQKLISLLQSVRKVLIKECMLLELETPVNICGDIHGQYMDLLQIFKDVGKPATTRYLFLGDYVDRGNQSLESICLLFVYKLKYPTSFHLLRGNHEDATMNEMYGFYDECKRRYSIKLWKCFTDVFNCLSIAAVVGGAIFCCHGGLGPKLVKLSQIKKLKKPKTIPYEGLMCDLLWADPETQNAGDHRWKNNEERGVSYVFGEWAVRQFLENNRIQLICRAHEVVECGYEFFANKGLVTIFSAPLYTNTFDNDSAVLSVDSNLTCHFHIFKPNIGKARLSKI